MAWLSAHLLPTVDWLVTLGIGIVVTAAGVLLFRQASKGGVLFALALFTAETGMLVSIRALIAAGSSSRWQYIMPFALVLVPALYVAFILTRLRRWRRAGFTHPRDWRAPQAAVPLLATLALPAVGLWGRGAIPMVALILALQVVFMLIDVFMEEATYRGLVFDAIDHLPVNQRVLMASLLFGLSHIDNLFLPAVDEIGVLYQVFEATLIGILFTAVRLRMNAIWPVMLIHAAYNLMLILAFGHASPVTPTVPGFIAVTAVNLSLAFVGLRLVQGRSAEVRPLEAAA
jgi:membrane protease YdiL (CAAX protease family)